MTLSKGQDMFVTALDEIFNQLKRTDLSFKASFGRLWMPRLCAGSWRCHQDVLVQMFLDEVTEPRTVNKLHTTVLRGLCPAPAREPRRRDQDSPAGALLIHRAD